MYIYENVLSPKSFILRFNVYFIVSGENVLTVLSKTNTASSKI